MYISTSFWENEGLILRLNSANLFQIKANKALIINILSNAL